MTIRANLCDGLRNTLREVEGADLRSLDKYIFLPTNYPGSTCHMYKVFQDLVAITRFHFRHVWTTTIGLNLPIIRLILP